MFCEPVEIDELINLISNLNNNEGAGPDNIGPHLLKEKTPAIVRPFLYIINLSLSTGVVLDKLKLAKITPDYKKGDRCLRNGYLLGWCQWFLMILSVFYINERCLRSSLVADFGCVVQFMTSIVTCICWADSRSHWALLQRCHSRHYWPAAAQARLHAYCLFTRTFHCTELAREFADNTICSSEPDAQHSQFHLSELCDWPQPDDWTQRRLQDAAFPSWHCTLRPCYIAAVSCFWLSLLYCMYWVAHWRNGYSVGLAINRSCGQILLGSKLRTNLWQVVYTYVTLRGAGVPPSAFAAPLSILFLIFCSLLLFPFFLFSFTLLIFLYCPSDPFLPESSHSVSRRERS